MAELIDALPGIELPVSEVTNRLATMWEGEMAASLSEFRASQMNVVLHFGLEVTPEEARERFDTVIQFAQRYPSRIIVLCPGRKSEDGSMTAKLFSQCYIGESHREMCCCEALLLSFESEDFGYLSNQVSVWLEGDLPTYHWFSGVPAARIKKYYDNLLVGVRCVVYDSSIESDDLAELDWPHPEKVSDLSRARLLPVRQALGQYLSGYTVEALYEGLSTVTVTHCASMAGEGKHLFAWLKDCFGDCEQYLKGGQEIRFVLQSSENTSSDDDVLSIDFAYGGERYFRWSQRSDAAICEIESRLNLDRGVERVPLRVKALASEQVLSEALFF